MVSPLALVVPFAAMVGVAVITWLVSLRLRDASIVDSVWSLMFLAFAAGLAGQHGLPRPDEPHATVAYPLLTLLGLWAVRLSAYITWRNHGRGEDRRYQAIRARHEPGFAWKSLGVVFLLQATLALVVALPVAPLLLTRAPANALTGAGFLVAAFGGVYEAVADAQLARFRATRASADLVMDQGLWRTSRHPNYFGEAVFWWGVWLASCSVGGAWTAVSPALMTWLLLRVSGVPLLEADLRARRPAYADYLRRTSSFVPWWPRDGRGP